MDNLKTTYCNNNFNKFREKMVHDLFYFYNVAVFDSKVRTPYGIVIHTCVILCNIKVSRRLCDHLEYTPNKDCWFMLLFTVSSTGG